MTTPPAQPLGQCQGDRDPEIYGQFQRCPNPAVTTRYMSRTEHNAAFCQDCADLIDSIPSLSQDAPLRSELP